MGSPETEAAKILASATIWTSFFLALTRMSTVAGLMVLIYKGWKERLEKKHALAIALIEKDKVVAKENSVGVTAIEKMSNQITRLTEKVDGLDSDFKQFGRDLLLRNLHQKL